MRKSTNSQSDVKQSFLTVRRSNNSSLSSLFSMNIFKFLYTRGSTLTLFMYLGKNRRKTMSIIRVSSTQIHFVHRTANKLTWYYLYRESRIEQHFHRFLPSNRTIWCVQSARSNNQRYRLHLHLSRCQLEVRASIKQKKTIDSSTKRSLKFCLSRDDKPCRWNRWPQLVDECAFLYFSNRVDNFREFYRWPDVTYEPSRISANLFRPETDRTKVTNNQETMFNRRTLTLDDALSMMYLLFPRMFSVHMTNHETLLSCRTSFHWCPSGGLGITASWPMLMIMSSGRMRFLTQPIFGCSPRPRKRPGGSIL